LLSERRFFAEFLDSPEPAPAAVMPSDSGPEAFASRLLELARPRLDYLADKSDEWWLWRHSFFDVKRERIWISGDACCTRRITAHS
jgi:hypothetical protein